MSNDVTPYVTRTDLPPDMAREVERLADDVPPGTDRLDNPWTFLVHDPRAQSLADAMRAERGPAAPAVIVRWLTDLGLATAPLERDALRGRIAMAGRFLGGLPAFCWNEDTLTLAVSRFTHYPSVAELTQLLKPVAERHQRQIEVLERMAMAPQRHPTQESTVPYVLPPPPTWLRPAGTTRDNRPGFLFEVPEAKPGERGAHGIGSVVEDLLAKRRKEFGR